VGSPQFDREALPQLVGLSRIDTIQSTIGEDSTADKNYPTDYSRTVGFLVH
jgi:hypothetical protein